MVNIVLDMDVPRECHECPLQLKFKDGEVDDWYSRRCVLMERIIEYPRPDWCPLQQMRNDEALFKTEDSFINWISAYYSAPANMIGDTEEYEKNQMSWRRLFREWKKQEEKG